MPVCIALSSRVLHHTMHNIVVVLVLYLLCVPSTSRWSPFP